MSAPVLSETKEECTEKVTPGRGDALGDAPAEPPLEEGSAGASPSQDSLRIRMSAQRHFEVKSAVDTQTRSPMA